MKTMTLAILLSFGAFASAHTVSVGPDSLNCRTVSMIETYKTLTIVKPASGLNWLSIQDMSIITEQGEPKQYTIASYLSNEAGDNVLSADEINVTMGLNFKSVEVVLTRKSNFKAGSLTYFKTHPRGREATGEAYELTCQ